MNEPLSATLESVAAVINREPFEALASLSANVIENLRSARQHWP